jgi:hypothetical protein
MINLTIAELNELIALEECPTLDRCEADPDYNSKLWDIWDELDGKWFRKERFSFRYTFFRIETKEDKEILAMHNIAHCLQH